MMIENLLRDNIKNIKAYSSARDEYKDATADKVFIDANENPYETDLNRYPDPQQSKVKQRISEIRNIPVSNILLGNGSDEVLDLIFRAFCEPNRDSVITLPPTYGMYKVLADLNAVKIKEVPLTIDYQPNVEDVLTVQNSTSKLLFICSPNNPTGFQFSKKDRGSRIFTLLSKFLFN